MQRSKQLKQKGGGGQHNESSEPSDASTDAEPEHEAILNPEHETSGEGGHRDDSNSNSLTPLAASLHEGANNKDDLLMALGMKTDADWNLWSARPDLQQDVPLGRIWMIRGTVMKAVCSRHPACTLMLNADGRMQDIECVLLKWLAFGWADTTTASLHESERDHMRMSLRKRR